MSPRRQAQPELDQLIAEIAVDCYNEDEALTAFENAFDDQAASFPLAGTVVGEPVEVVRVMTRYGRRDLTATCKRNRQQYHIALLDIDIHTERRISNLIAAYRCWHA